MKVAPKQILKIYFNSWWLPALAFFVLALANLALVVLYLDAMIPYGMPIATIANGLFFAAGLALFGVLGASVWNLIQKRRAKGLINLLLFSICCVGAFFAYGYLMLAYFFGPSNDGFADKLNIPDDIEIAEPLEELELQLRLNGERDAFQKALLAALQAPGSGDTTVFGNIASLARLQRNSKEILRHYLAASPTWRVFQENGDVFATRRWMIGSEWHYQLHGGYTNYEAAPESGTLKFQSRCTIGLSGKPWWRGDENTTWLKAGDAAKAKLSEGNQLHGSHCVIASDALVVEVSEESGAPERRLTKAALNFVDAELEPLAEDPSREKARKILPSGSIRIGEPSFDLRNSFQPGLYDSMIWVNPGEPGMLYLKAFEVTKGTPLSAIWLKEASNEWIGWSDNPEEMFFSNTHFTIGEGDWGKPYAARFEVWFVPDSGSPERKLIEKVFKIEGAQ